MNDRAEIVVAPVGELDRKTYLGGSDAAALLGLDPYGKTPLTVYLAKRGELGDVMDPAKKLFLARRKRWEGPIVEMLREEFDGEIVAVNQRYVDVEHAFLAAEIDFEWRDGEGRVQNGEIKTVSPFAFGERFGWGEAGTDEIPVHYHAQVMHGLGVMRRETCIVAAMAGLDSMTFYRVDRDDETIAGMRQVEVDFWVNNVQAGVPPDPITTADVGRLMNRRAGRPTDLDDETAAAIENLRQVREAKKALEGDEAELELKVGKFICKAWGLEEGAEPPPKDNGILLHNGVKVATWAAGRGAHLDQRALAEAHPDIKAAFTVPHYYRTFRFPKLT